MPFCNQKKGKPIIISAGLTRLEEQILLETLRKYKEPIAWSIEDLKGFSPSIGIHKILLEENARTFVEHPASLRGSFPIFLWGSLLVSLSLRASSLLFVGPASLFVG